MKIYTKGGDQGFTSLLNNSRVSKTDDRIELVGMIDELNAHLGLAKVVSESALKEDLSQIQRTLMRIMSGVVSASGEFKTSEAEVRVLEDQIDKIEASIVRPKEFVLYGGCELWRDWMLQELWRAERKGNCAVWQNTTMWMRRRRNI